MRSDFKSFVPENELLKKYIAYFYFDHSPDNSFHKQYSFFPHTYTTLTFYDRATLTVLEDVFRIEHNARAGLLKLLTRQHSIKTVIQNGILDKIGIVFYPLGLNHFIGEDYRDLAKEEVQHFMPLNNGEWEQLLHTCFSTTGIQERLQLIESFLLSLYKPKEYTTLYAVIKALGSIENNASIKEIAASNWLNQRKLNRDLNKELSISPEMFRMISRFRYVVEQKAIQNTGKKFTALTYDGGYYDQSFMIRTFKKLTGLTPTDFFKHCELLGNNGTLWKIDNTKNVV